MPKPKPSERMSFTSCYIPERCLKWIEDRKYVKATFIRIAVEEKIKRESGFSSIIEKTTSEIAELEHELKTKKSDLENYKVKNEEWKRKEKEVDLSTTVETAILKVEYKNFLECTRDLRELKPAEMSWQSWADYVKDVWSRLKVNRK